jgi:hypothetical protein
MWHNLRQHIEVIQWRRLFKRHIAAFVVFLGMSWMFMGTSLTSCSNTLIGSIGGDHISGIIWFMKYTTAPYGGFSHVTNFPYGESVAQPQLITSALHMVPTWLLAKVVGPVCSWNLMVLAGYMLSAITMYAFIYWLIRHRGVALFAGIAVGFTPYHYYKTNGHLSYIQSQLFVLLLWSFIAMWRAPSKFKAVLFGVLVACLFYGDGYFPLIGGSMLAACLAFAIGAKLISRTKKSQAELKLRLRYLLLSAATCFVLILPIAAVQLMFGQRIHNSLTAARGNVLLEIKVYGAHPADFFLPSETHPIPVVQRFVSHYRATHVYSNNGEYHLFLGYTVMALAAYALYFALRRRAKRETEQESLLRWVTGMALAITIICGLISAVPIIRIFGVKIPLPSFFIGHLTSLWRVFARMYLAINVGAVTLAAIGLWQLRLRFKKQLHRGIIIAILTLLMIVEFLPVNPFSRIDQWALSTASPTYWWLKGQKDIKDIAAYPIIEHPGGTTYFGDQVVHEKPLLNSDAATDSQLLLHRAIAGLGDGQTLGVLKGLGINDILLYRTSIQNESQGLTQLYGTFGARVDAIKPNIQAINNVLTPDTGFAKPTIDDMTQISCRQSISSVASMTVKPLNSKSENNVPIHFDIKGKPGQSVIVHVDGMVVYSTTFSSIGQLKPVDLTVNDNQVITVYDLSDPSFGFTEICNLGSAR